MTGRPLVAPYHVWRRNETLYGWSCVTPEPCGRRTADRCPGCGTFVSDLDMKRLEDLAGPLTGSILDVHLAYALAHMNH